MVIACETVGTPLKLLWAHLMALVQDARMRIVDAPPVNVAHCASETIQERKKKKWERRIGIRKRIRVLRISHVEIQISIFWNANTNNARTSPTWLPRNPFTKHEKTTPTMGSVEGRRRRPADSQSTTWNSGLCVLGMLVFSLLPSPIHVYLLRIQNTPNSKQPAKYGCSCALAALCVYAALKSKQNKQQEFYFSRSLSILARLCFDSEMLVSNMIKMSGTKGGGPQLNVLQKWGNNEKQKKKCRQIISSLSIPWACEKNQKKKTK